MDKSEYARMYHLESEFWWYKVLHELTDKVIDKKKGNRIISILDAGCGTGRMMEICQKHGTVYGIDYSDDALEFAGKRGLENVEKGDLNTYSFQKDAYDVLLCLDVLYHTGIQSDIEVLRNFFDAIKPGGLLILNLPAFECLRRSHDEIVYTKKRYRKKAFTAELKKIGFLIKISSYRMPHLFFIILLSKLFMNLRKPKKPESDLKEIPVCLNRFLFLYGKTENYLILKGLTIPLGSSLFIVAQKSA